MKITFISTMEGFPWGGSEELWYSVAKEALIKKHEVQVCVKEWKEEPKKIKELRREGVIIIKRENTKTDLLARVLKKLNINDTKTKFTKAITDFSPECLLISQAMSFDFFWSATILNLVQKLKKPYFLISQFNFENSNKLNEKLYVRIKELNHKWTQFYFVSRRNLQTAERQAALKFDNIKFIDNPVNITCAEQLEWPQTAALQMACVARFDCNFKGQDLLFEALADPLFTNVNYELNLFGSGPDEAYLQRLISYFQLHKVKIKGHVANIDKIWKHHHVLILPSIAEGTPLALQECMLKGRTALVTDVGDCSKLIEDGVTGFLCAAPTVKLLKEKLSELFAATPEKLKEMAGNAFVKASNIINTDSYKIILADIESIEK